MSNQKIIIDILGKSSLAIPTLSNEDQLKMRYIEKWQGNCQALAWAECSDKLIKI